MVKEKITALIKKDDKNNKKKIENLIFAFVLLVITLISINIIFKDNKKTNNKNTIETNSKEIEKTADADIELKQELEEIIKEIKGVRRSKNTNYIQ